MKFGAVPVAEALGCVLAHSVRAGPMRLKKGTTLTADDVAALRSAGITNVTVARLGPDDVAEDDAAAQLATRLKNDHLLVGEAFTGRVNLHAEKAGVLRVDRSAIAAFNAVDEAITLATLPDYARVEAGTMVATVKIIPYAVTPEALARAERTLAAPALTLAPFLPLSATVILTRIPGLKDTILTKGGEVTAKRLAQLGIRHSPPIIVPHEAAALADAVAGAQSDLVLILGGSATSDRADVVPAGIEAAGGVIERFGMPVDPGNLLLLARKDAMRIIGLPGCARSPALNGADWVLERIAAGLDVTGAEIAAMGVGGLLKEIPTRPQPRSRAGKSTPRTTVLILGAGQGTRMRGGDKLLEPVGDQPLIRALAKRAFGSDAAQVVITTSPDHPARRAALSDLPVEVIDVENAAEGMSASLRAAMQAKAVQSSDAVIVMLGDMPDISTGLLNRLIADFAAAGPEAIIRPALPDGRAGHPVLFGKAHFNGLRAATGDKGAREVIAAARDHLRLIEVEDEAPLTDLDTPEDWTAWRAARES